MKKRYKTVAPLPTELNILLKKYLETHNACQILLLEKLQKNLEKIVGTYLLNQVVLTDLKQGILTIKTPSSAWKSELFLQKKAIIGKCNHILETPAIKDIRFI